MKLSKLINREVEAKPLNEAIKGADILDLYAYAGIKTKYSDDVIERYGQKVVDEAIKNAPKYLAFAKEVKEMAGSKLAKDFHQINDLL